MREISVIAFLNRVAGLFADIFDLIGRELKVIITSFSIMVVIVAGNIFYAFFYPSPYLNDVLHKQKIAVVDEDRTQKSREFIFNTNAQIRTEIIANTSMQNAQNMLKLNEIYGILYIPQDFEKNGIKSSLPKVYYIANNSYFLIYSSILEGLNSAASAIDFKTTQMLFSGESSPINAPKNPIQPEFIALFNPSVGYLNYILAAVLIFILHQTMVIACGILCGTQILQYEQYYFHQTLPQDSPSTLAQKMQNLTQKITLSKNAQNPLANRISSHISKLSNAPKKAKNPNDDLYFLHAKSPILLIFARVSAFIVIYFPLFLFYFGFIYSYYNLTTFASSINLILFGIVFIVATASFGIFLGFLFSRREYVPQITLVMSVPLLFGLGIIYPSQSIPSAIKIFMDFIPIAPAVSGFLKLNQMGADFGDIWGEFLHLFLLGVGYAFVAYLILQRRFKNVWQ